MGYADVREHVVRPEFDLDETGSSESSEEPVDLGFLPDTVKRQCTDLPTLAVFLVALLGLVACMYHGLTAGELLHDGDLCGQGRHKGQPFLFFCLRNATASEIRLFDRVDRTPNVSHTGALELAYPLCVNSCPSGRNTAHQCNPQAAGPTPDYQTDPFIAMICRPKQPHLIYQLQEWVVSHREIHTIASLSSFCRAWHVLAGCTALAVVASYGYIFLLRNCAAYLVWAGFLILTVGPIIGSIYYFYCWEAGGCQRRFSEAPPRDIFFGLCLLGVGTCFLLIIINRGDSVDLAVDCLTASCECVMETTFMRFVPLVSICARALLTYLQVECTLLLLSGSQSREVIGNWNRLSPSTSQWAMIVYVESVFLWMHLAVGASADFATVYATEVWYFTNDRDKAPTFVVVQAFWAAFRYHLGTIAFGGLVLGITSPLRKTLGFLDSHARTAHTPVGLVIGLVCCCCVNCYDRFFAFLNHNAYMDVAMNAKGFCCAARDAYRVTRNEEEAVQILNGVTWVFQIFGLCSIAFLGETVTFVALKNHFSDPASPTYVHNPEVVEIAGAILSAAVAIPFLAIFDTVSDTIIYCYSVKRIRTASGGVVSDVEGCLMGAINAVSEWAYDIGCGKVDFGGAQEDPLPDTQPLVPAQFKAAAQARGPELVPGLAGLAR